MDTNEKLNKTMDELQEMADFKSFEKVITNEELTPEQFWLQQPPMKNIPDAIREYHELKMTENDGIEKSGMYGEMPKIKIGKYTIADMSNEVDCKTIWIEDTTTGEGGQFSKETLLPILEKYYREHF